MRVAYVIAREHPQQAVKLLDEITSLRSKVEGLGWVADALIDQDRALAYSLIERAVLALAPRRDDRSYILDGWGNEAGHAAWLAIRAQAMGYPHVDEIVARALSLRDTAKSSHSPIRAADSHVATAMILAFTDKVAARHIIERIEAEYDLFGAGSDVLGGGMGHINMEHWLEAWTLVDPARAAEYVERAIRAKPDEEKQNRRHRRLFKVVDLLTADRNGKLDIVLERRGGAFWFPGEE